jgi:dihydrofolate reductase
MRLSMIVAAAENGVIGRGGELPWQLSGDLKRFKALTMGHAIIMGRKTWEAIGRPLPGRRMIVVTRQPYYVAGGAEVVNDVATACRLAESAGDQEAFIIGGGEVYRHSLALTDRVYLTRVHAAPDGDAFFPPLDPQDWRQCSRESHPADAKNEFAYTFEIHERRTANDRS